MSAGVSLMVFPSRRTVAPGGTELTSSSPIGLLPSRTTSAVAVGEAAAAVGEEAGAVLCWASGEPAGEGVGVEEGPIQCPTETPRPRATTAATPAPIQSVRVEMA